ncbi:MAG: hypothetical protein V1799_15625 [bacterium]
MLKPKISLLVLLALAPRLAAQTQEPAASAIEPTMLIEKPTAGMLGRGMYRVTTNFFERGGVLFGISVGVMDRFMFGVTYGGTGILGHEKAMMNSYPGVQAKLRVIEESTSFPAWVFGFDSQGFGPYDKGLDRYTVKSPGFYTAVSQNYALAGNLSAHLGILYSLERDDDDKDVDFFVGVEKSVGKNIALLAEFDAATNDNHGRAFGKNRGYLNLGLRWSISKELILGFDLKNMTKNQDGIIIGNRTLQLEYISRF